MDKTTQKGNAGSAAPVGAAKPQGVLVLGMHRSGTSACTRVLNLLGCALSDKLLGVGEGNETGHWESVDAITLNDEILASAGSSHEDWGSINPDWRASAIREQMVHRAAGILGDHAAIGPLFAIKDPRMCRLADVWLDAATEVQIEPLVILMLRNPIEVSASLEARDLMSIGYGELLWLRHVLDAEYLSRGQKRVTCRYDDLMTNWQRFVAKIKTGLNISFPRNSPKIHAEISQFLSHAQRHHVANTSHVIDNPSYSDWLRKTFQIMLDWSDRGENPEDYPVLDEVRAEFDRAYGAFARMLLTTGSAGEVGSGGELRREVANSRDEIERMSTALKQAAQDAEALRATAAAELAAHVEAQTSSVAAMQAEIERLNAVLADHATSNEEATALQSSLADRTAELAAAQSALDDAQAQADAELQRRADAEEQLTEASVQLHEQQLRNAELTGQIAALQSALIQRQEELAQLLAQLHESERARLRAEIEGAQELGRSEQWEERLADADAEISSLKTAHDDARIAYQQQVDALTSDLARTTALLQEQEQASEEAAQKLLEQAAEARHTSDRIEQLSAAASNAEAARAQSVRQLAARFEELARLTAILVQESGRADGSESMVKWLRDVHRLEESFPLWWAIMPQVWRQRRARRRYYGAGLFDADAYLALNPDVAAHRMEPIRHYILHGMAEGRTLPTPA